jgi:hypothetical protein
MQSACPSEFMRIVGSTLLVEYPPHALGRYTVLQGIPDNSLRFSWYAKSLLSWTLALLQSMTRKQPVAERPFRSSKGKRPTRGAIDKSTEADSLIVL